MLWMQFVPCGGTYHFGGGVKNLHLLQDGGAIVGDGDITFLILDLKQTTQNSFCLETRCMSEDLSEVKSEVKCVLLTILSIPLGPRLVLMASATAVKTNK